MRYKINFLDNEEFEALPYKDVETSLGLADSKKSEAYVRKTGLNILDVYTAMHELEHLEEGQEGELAHHEKYGDGVYYKGFSDAFSGIGQSVGGALGNIAGAAQNVGQSIGQGVGNVLSSFGGGFQGGKNPSGGLAASAAANPALRAPANYYATAPGSSITPFSYANMGASSQNFRMPTPRMDSTQGMGGMSSPSLGKLSSQTQTFPITAQVGQQPVQTPPTSQTQASGGLGLNMDIGKVLGGGAMALLGNRAGGGAHLPDMSNLASVQAFKNFDLRGNLNQLDPGLEAAINRDFDQMDQQEQHDFQARWKNIRPGADIESDSVYKRDYQNLIADQQQRRADAMAKYRFDYVKTQLGINELEAQRLQQLAQLDVDTISFNTGLDAQQSMQLKQMFYGTGMNMVSAGLGMGGNNLSFSGTY